MPRCPFCDHPNPPGTERCESCGAWVVQGVEPGADQGRSPERGPTPEVAGDLAAQVLTLMAEGRKIEAIKRYRERTGAGLKAAKDAVEALAARHGLPTAGRSGCLGAIALLIAAVALAWNLA